MGFELRIRASERWPSPPELVPNLRDFDVRIVDPSPGGYSRVTYEVRCAANVYAMPDAHVQVEDDGFYLCENGAPVPGLLEQLIRYALRAGPVAIEEL